MTKDHPPPSEGEGEYQDMETPRGEGRHQGPETPLEEVDDLPLLQEQMEEVQRENEQFRTMAQRAQADLANFKRRAADERLELRKAANSDLLLKALSVVDDLERALALVPEEAVAPGWLEGLQLVQGNLARLLESEGIKSIEAKGQPFEPWEHEAVMYEETTEAEEGMVVRVIRAGYRLNDRVLRAAQVAVSKAPDTLDQQETTSKEA